MACRAVLFDIDGTLVHSLPLYVATINHVLEADGLGPLDATTVKGLFVDNIEFMIHEAFRLCGKPLYDGAYTEVLDRYMAFYLNEEHSRKYVEPYIGVPETLEALRQAGLKLGIVTNRPYEAAVGILKVMGFLSYFSEIFSIDRVTKNKPDPAHLHETLEQMGLAPHEAIMVGDHDMDVVVSKRVGTPVIIVTYGYALADPKTLGADALIENFKELPEAIRGLA